MGKVDFKMGQNVVKWRGVTLSGVKKSKVDKCGVMWRGVE